MSNVTSVLLGFFVFAYALVAPMQAHASTHIVSPGESLFTISRNYGISLNSLMEANGIWDSMIYPGQRLYVPENGSSGGSSYTVRAGDSLYQIGQKFGVSYQEIMSANNLKSTYINPGMSLYIPATIPGRTAQPSGLVSRGGLFQRPAVADVGILARLITAEADGEPYEGKVAVGAVVLNRVISPDFPKSIRDVIYQYDQGTYQFEPVMNGWINRPASSESLKAAKDALSGKDPTNGALYFFATYVKNSWLWSRPLSRIIGNHVFTY
ncbi:MAG: Spore cortex-lytic enzyme precursor [Pelotomaculum sp. PtaB.Bin104]|nr:MAG: Spore cortex-lytic enzyme precursor [Pelotomaculum sp. PtaB.Bin104]